VSEWKREGPPTRRHEGQQRAYETRLRSAGRGEGRDAAGGGEACRAR